MLRETSGSGDENGSRSKSVAISGTGLMCVRARRGLTQTVNVPIVAVVMADPLLILLYAVIASLFGPSLVLVYPFIEGR